LTGTHPLILSGLTLMVLGLAFKTGLVPFHFWVPDVYEGSPDVITGYMSTVAKLTAFVGLLKLFFVGYAIYGVVAKPLLVMVVASLILANLWGLSQQSTRRTLAYSGISHAGFLGIAMVTFAHNLGGAVYWYALSYALASLSAFYVLDQIGDYDMADIEGLLRRNRLLGVLLCVSLLSLAGIPPFAGFFGKMFVLIGAIGAGFFGLAILAVIASVVGAGYYVALIRKTTEATHHPILRLSTGASALAVVLLILQLIIIISPNFAILPILGGHYCGL
ncbi:NADH-quinone oxidoreductase subunit N, partial [bacterium]|nr:NADH-quinone oxidoreductase subunit N [bacterium]